MFPHLKVKTSHFGYEEIETYREIGHIVGIQQNGNST